MAKNFIPSLLIALVLFASGLFSSLRAQTPEELVLQTQNLITQVEDYQNQLNNIAIAVANELDDQTFNIIQTLIDILNSLLNDIRLQLYTIYQQLLSDNNCVSSSGSGGATQGGTPGPWFYQVPNGAFPTQRGF